MTWGTRIRIVVASALVWLVPCAAVRAQDAPSAAAQEAPSAAQDASAAQGRLVVHSFPGIGVAFRAGDGVGFALEDGRVMAEPVWDDVQISGEFEEGGIWVKKGSRWGVLWPEGTEMFEPRFDGYGFFYRGRASVQEGGVSVLIDASGKVLFRKSGVDRIIRYVEGSGAVVTVGAKMGFVGTDGAFAVPAEYARVRLHEAGGRVILVEAWDERTRVLFRPDGSAYSKARYEEVGTVRDADRVAVRVGGKWGVVCGDEELIAPKYDAIEDAGGLLWAREGRVWHLYDAKGRRVDGVEYDGYRRGTGFLRDYLFVRAGGRSWVMDAKGRAVSPTVAMGEILDYYPELGVTWILDGRLGFSSADRKTTVQPQFEAFDFSKLRSGKLIGVADGKQTFIKVKAPGKKSEFFRRDTMPITDELVLVRESGRVGLSDAYGNAVLAAEYDEITVDGANVWARRGARWGLYSMQRSAWTIEPRYHGVDRGTYPGVYYVLENGARSVVYEDGTVLVPPIYVDRIVEFLSPAHERREWLREGMADGVVFETGGKLGFAGSDGIIVLAPEFDTITSQNGYFAVGRGGRMGVYSGTGRTVVPVEQDDIVLHSVQRGIIWYRRGDRWGLYRTNGQMVSSPIYDGYTFIANDNAIRVHQGKDSFVINYLGEKVYPSVESDGIEEYAPDRGIVFTKAHRYGFANSLGKVVVPAEYESLTLADWPSGVIWAKKDGRWGILDAQGKALTGFEYDAHSSFVLGWANVYVGRTAGLIRPDGTRLVEPVEADRIEDFLEASGYAIFVREGRRGIATARGDVVVPAQYDAFNLTAASSGYIWYRLDGKWGLYTTDGTKRTEALFDAIGEFYHDSEQDADIARVYVGGVEHALARTGAMHRVDTVRAFADVQRTMRQCDLYFEQRIVPEADVWKEFTTAVDDWHARSADAGDPPDAATDAEIARRVAQYHAYSFQNQYAQILSAHAKDRASDPELWAAFMDTVAHLDPEKNKREVELSRKLAAAERDIIMNELDAAMEAVRAFHNRNEVADVETYGRFDRAAQRMRFAAANGGEKPRDYDDMDELCTRMEKRQNDLFLTREMAELRDGGPKFTTDVYHHNREQCMNQKIQYETVAQECRRARDMAEISPSVATKAAYESQQRILQNIRRGCEEYIPRDSCEP